MFAGIPKSFLTVKHKQQLQTQQPQSSSEQSGIRALIIFIRIHILHILEKQVGEASLLQSRL